MFNYIKYLDEIIRPYMGWKIIGTKSENLPERQAFGLIISKGEKKRILWIESDEEGNDTGFLLVDSFNGKDNND